MPSPPSPPHPLWTPEWGWGSLFLQAQCCGIMLTWEWGISALQHPRPALEAYASLREFPEDNSTGQFLKAPDGKWPR